MEKLPVYTWDIDINAEDEGVFTMSIVDDPAVEKAFVKFSKNQRQAKKLTIDKYSINEEKRVVTGVAIRANYPIYRNDSDLGEYYCVFEPQAIEKIVHKFMKDKNNSEVNINHSKDVSGIYLFESFILRDELRLNLPEFKDVENGSWMTSYKIDNPEVWEKIKAGDLNGYSIEISGSLEKVDKEFSAFPFTRAQLMEIYQTINNLKMSDVLKKCKVKLARALKVGFNAIDTDKGSLQYDGELGIGTDVYILDDAGEMQPAPDGEYKTEDGTVIEVVSGVVTDMKNPGSTGDEMEEDLEEDLEEADPLPDNAEEVTPEDYNALVEILNDVVSEVIDLREDVAQIEEFKKTIKAQDEKIEQQAKEIKQFKADFAKFKKEPAAGVIENGSHSHSFSGKGFKSTGDPRLDNAIKGWNTNK